MRAADADWLSSLAAGLSEAEWALVSSGPSPGRTLRIAPHPLPCDGRALGLSIASAPRIDGPLICSETMLPFEDGAWPRIVLHHVVERPAVSRALLREAIRVLAPGGELVVFGLDPLAPAVLARWLLDRRWREAVAPVPPRRLAHVLGLSGLADVRITGHGPRWRPLPRPEELADTGGIGRCLYLLRARKLEARVIPWRRAVVPSRLPAGGLAPSAGRRALRVA